MTTVGADVSTAREAPGDAGDRGVGDGGRIALSPGSGHGRAEIISDLRSETMAAAALIEQLRELIADDDLDVIANTIEGETSLHLAIEKAFGRLAELNGLMDGIAGMMASLKDRGERFEKQRDRIREMIVVAMEVGQIKRMETPLGTISLRSTPPSVQVIDEAAIPARFWKPSDPKLDRRALLSALKADEAVPGATLSNGGSTIQVRFS